MTKISSLSNLVFLCTIHGSLLWGETAAFVVPKAPVVAKKTPLQSTEAPVDSRGVRTFNRETEVPRVSVDTQNSLAPPAPPGTRYSNDETTRPPLPHTSAPPMTRYEPRTSYNNYNMPAAVAAGNSGPWPMHGSNRRMPSNSGIIQGGSRESWSSQNPINTDRSVAVNMETDGRPLHADFEVWEGPGNTSQRMRVYSEDGRRRPFQAFVETPRQAPPSMSVRNVGPLEFPLAAGVQGMGGATMTTRSPTTTTTAQQVAVRSKRIQGGDTLRTWDIDATVGSVLVNIHSEGMPIQAVVEIWQGPGTVKQLAEIYADDGRNKPFSAVVETPGWGCSIAIRNTGPLEYPIDASVVPYCEKQSYNNYDYYGGGPDFIQRGSSSSYRSYDRSNYDENGRYMVVR